MKELVARFEGTLYAKYVSLTIAEIELRGVEGRLMVGKSADAKGMDRAARHVQAVSDSAFARQRVERVQRDLNRMKRWLSRESGR